MKVSVSGRPDALRAAGAARGMRSAPWWCAAAYLAAHLPFLAPSLEDIDSINFALGLRDFDPAQHQPHPPGYPVYIAFGRASLFIVDALTRGLNRPAREALALAFWSAIAGAAAIVFAYQVFRSLDAASSESRGRARLTLWATLFLACSPLFWMTGLRPMTDMPGLAVALGAQALLMAALEVRRPDPFGPGGEAGLTEGERPALRAISPRVLAMRPETLLLGGAFVAGFGVGIRSQTLWLTLPLLLFVLVNHAWPQRLRITACAGGAFVTGALVWAIPLVVASGGPEAYLQALSAQAGEDFAFVDLLWSNRTSRALAFALYRTFVLPWAFLPLAMVVLVATALGALSLLQLRERRALSLLVAAYGPYVVFHLIFQETVTVRYALPVLPMVCFLAARSLALSGRAVNVLSLPLAAGALIVAVPGSVAYGRQAHPAARAVDDMARRGQTDRPAFVTAHEALRRSLKIAELNAPTRLTPALEARLELARYWASGGSEPVWVLADPRRTDLELIDRFSRLDVVRYRWAAGDRAELGGTRPRDADWYRLAPPGWFLDEGWSLTPETGGIVAARLTGPDRGPIVGYVRRNRGPMHMMIGGRHLGGAADGAVAFEMALDGLVLDRWRLTFAERNFLRFVPLPDGIPAGPDAYARLVVTSRPDSLDRARSVPVAVRQFDVQPITRIIYGFGEGWHEAEYEFATGLQWRWTSERSVIHVQGPAAAMRLSVRGESPLKYFDEPPTVTIRAGTRILGRFQPASDFVWEVPVPAEALAASGGALSIDTDRFYVPAAAEGTSDLRRLGLRIFECTVDLDR